MRVEELEKHIEEVESTADQLKGRGEQNILPALLVKGVWQCALQLARIAELLATKPTPLV